MNWQVRRERSRHSNTLDRKLEKRGQSHRGYVGRVYRSSFEARLDVWRPSKYRPEPRGKKTGNLSQKETRLPNSGIDEADEITAHHVEIWPPLQNELGCSCGLYHFNTILNC